MLSKKTKQRVLHLYSIAQGAQVQEKAVDSSIIKPGEDESKAKQCCDVHGEKTFMCAIHESHVGGKDEPVLRKGQVTKVYDPYVEAKDLEDKLNVTHELDTITQLSAIIKPLDLEITGSFNATKVGQHLSMLRATPGSIVLIL